MNTIRFASAVLLAALIAGPAWPQEQSATPTTQAAQETPPPMGTRPERIRVPADVEDKNVVHRVFAIYPPVSRRKMTGTVVLHVIISQDGSVQKADAVSGPEYMWQSALDAVKQWKYRLTMLNGRPVEVDTTVNVVFSFDEPTSTQPPPAPPEVPADSKASAAAPVATPIAGLKPADAPSLQPPRRALRIRVGGSVQSANLIHRVEPIYPPEVKSVGISGTVILHIMVATNGSVEQVEFVSGPQELMAAAMSAVKQWRYRPTRLNGEPVEVDTTVTVVFSIE